jgi:hypothetical protein
MRLLAALLAPIVAVIALLAWVPTHGGSGLHAVSDIAAVQPATPKAATHERSIAHRSPSRGATGGSAARHVVEAPLPLGVTMDVLTPGVVPKRAPVVVRGRVVNKSSDTWTDINVYACTSHQPITSAAEIAAASATDSSAVTCGRTSVFMTIDRIAPHQSKRYHLRVPRDELGIGTTPGVYWFSIQALGSSPEGRDGTADGNVRSFLPLVEKPETTAEVSLVLPLRRSSAHSSDGRLVDPEGWADDLGPGGRLANLLNLAEQAPSGSVSLLTDPAVVAAARQIASGNLPRSIGPTETPPTPDIDAVSRSAAAAWVERFRSLALRQRVLALPYGDLDIAAATENDASVVTRAFDQSQALFRELEINADLVVAPPSGVLPSDALPALNRATVLLSDAALPDEVPAPDSATAEGSDSVISNGHPVRIYSVSLASGGPGPTNGLRTVALRQRILADASVRALDDDDRPMLVVLPDQADPGASADEFFGELDRNFIDLGTSLAGTDDAPEVGDLSYSQRQAEGQVDSALFPYVDQLVDLGHSLDVLLPRVDNVASTAVREALSAASYQAVEDDGSSATTLAALTSTVNWFSSRLDQVTIDAPRFVILSSRTGLFAMTVTNELDQPIRISVRATTDKSLVIRAPRTIDVPAASSRTVNLSAEATAIGVHSVVLVATDANGRTIQKSEEISIRTNNSGRVIWVIMAGGAALLFGAIILRLVRSRKARA